MKTDNIIQEKNKKSIFKILTGKNETEQESQEILIGLKEVKQNLDMVYMNFEYATDAALIDCYIYELKSLQMKYEYLMQRAKEKGLQAEGFERISS